MCGLDRNQREKKSQRQNEMKIINQRINGIKKGSERIRLKEKEKDKMQRERD